MKTIVMETEELLDTELVFAGAEVTVTGFVTEIHFEKKAPVRVFEGGCIEDEISGLIGVADPSMKGLVIVSYPGSPLDFEKKYRITIEEMG